MSIRVTCPSCESSFKARDGYAGKRVKCPACGRPLDVPDGADAGDEDSSQPARAPVKKPPVVAGSVPAPAAVIPPAVEAPPVATPPGVPNIVTGPAGSPSAGPTAASSHVARRPARSAMPVWAWVALASVATAIIVGVGVYAATRPDEPDQEVAAAVDRDAGPPTKGREAPKKTRPAPKKKEEPPEEPDGIDIESDEHGNIKRPKPIVAKTMEQVKDAVVKFETPVGPGKMSIGAGFFINNRGWVATNNHVVKDVTSATRIKMGDGAQCSVKGIVATAPDQDLAIVALENPPLRVTVLDIQSEDEPKLGATVSAMGHPHNLSFSLVSGNVGRVATTRELLADRPNPVLQRMKAPADLVWIQHSAKIAQGNSGGPLVDAEGRLLGINTFVNEMFGYAVHVRYLRALASVATESGMKPVPKPKPGAPGPTPGQPGPGQIAMSPQRLKQLFDACAGFGWKPGSQQQYDQLAELAKLMTVAKGAQLQPRTAPGAPAEVVKACAEAADKLFTDMKGVGWTAEHLAAVSKLAAPQLDHSGRGIVGLATVMGNAPDALWMQVEGSDKRFVVKVSPAVAQEPRGSHWLVLGLVTGNIAQIKDNHGNASQCRVLVSHYMFKVQ